MSEKAQINTYTINTKDAKFIRRCVSSSVSEDILSYLDTQSTSDVRELHLSEEQAQEIVEELLDALCSSGLEHDGEPNQQGIQIELLIDQFNRS